MNTITQPAITPAVSESKQAEKPDFGDGRMSVLMVDCFNTLTVRFRIDEKRAEKLARQIGSEYGAYERTAKVEAKIGKVSSKGKVNLTSSSKVKGISATDTLRILRACQWVEESAANGVAYNGTKWSLNANLQAHVDSLKVD